jgi:aminopeptidase N
MIDSETKIELRKMKLLLGHGDQRVLADRMETDAARVSDALNGRIKNQTFLTKLRAEWRKLMQEKPSLSI